MDTLEGACKDQVKSLFETFRETLIHVFDKDKEHSKDLAKITSPEIKAGMHMYINKCTILFIKQTAIFNYIR